MWRDRLLFDLRFALRQLVRHPGASILLVVTVAVAIGANVTMFSVMEGIVLSPLPYPDADRLLAVWETPEDGRWYQPFAGPDYLDVRAEARTLEEVGVLSQRWVNLSGGDQPVRLRSGSATSSLFRLLGVQAERGRLFTEEETVESHRVALLSHGLWQSQFGGEPDAVGRVVTLDGEPFEIVGVMPERFRFPTPWGGRDDTRIWTPLALDPDVRDRGSHWLGAYARMAPGATLEEVGSELDLIAGRLAEAYPDTNARTRMWVEPIMARTLGGIRSALIFLMATVALVLLVACANVASMLLARGMSRSSEFGIRASLGAGHRGLVRQLLTESTLLVVLGGLAGVLLASLGVDALRAALPESIPRAASIRIDLRVFGFAALVAGAAGILVGTAPALLAARSDLVEIMKQGRSGRVGGRSRFLSGLVTVQLAVGFVLVNGAVALAVSYRNVVDQPLHFAADDVLVTSISLAGPDYREPYQRNAFWEELATRARSLPGVIEAGITSKLPLLGGSNGGVLLEGDVFDPTVQRELVEYSFVDEGYHDAMGIPLVAGRTFEQSDLDAASAFAGTDATALVPVVVNRKMAETMWPPGTDVLGEVIRPNSPEEGYRATVVGVVEDVRQWGPEQEAIPEMYFPHTAEVWGPIWGHLVVRASSGPERLAAAVRETVRNMDTSLPTATPLTMGQVLRDATAARRFSLLLVTLFAGVALLLILAGTYGVLSYAVSQRTHEIGVRMSLGANTVGVMRLFLTRAGLLFLIGSAMGLVAAWAGSRLIASMVYNVDPTNGVHLLLAGAAMALVALAATAVPVARATGVHPTEALKAE